jgi:hypothetical protein
LGRNEYKWAASWVSSHEQIVAANRKLATRGMEKLGAITAIDATGLDGDAQTAEVFWNIF